MATGIAIVWQATPKPLPPRLPPTLQVCRDVWCLLRDDLSSCNLFVFWRMARTCPADRSIQGMVLDLPQKKYRESKVWKAQWALGTGSRDNWPARLDQEPKDTRIGDTEWLQSIWRLEEPFSASLWEPRSNTSTEQELTYITQGDSPVCWKWLAVFIPCIWHNLRHRTQNVLVKWW